MTTPTHTKAHRRRDPRGVALALVVLVSLGAFAAEPPAGKIRVPFGVHFQTEGIKVPIKGDGIHDPTNTAIEVLQEPVEAMTGFPRDDRGIINWVQTLNDGLINPRMALDPEEEMTPIDFDVILTNTASMPYVRFPHLPHTQWLTCINCHPKIFIPQRGGNPINMAAIIRGEYCGVCHGKVAFPPALNCGRCHSVPRQTALPR